jgi:S1-C subfamily serine protease
MAPRGRLLITLVLVAISLGACQASPIQTGSSVTTADLDAAYTNVVKAVAPSVVLIQTPSGGLGSGEVLDGQGNILTNAHVVGDATTFRVVTAGGQQLSGSLVSSFPPDDIAVIRVSGGAGLRPARFGDSSKLQVGQIVLAIGNPLGLQGSVTTGVVSALGRTVSEGPGAGTLPDAIQTSAAINPGNSGGALVDLRSEVIGIPTLAALSPGSQSAPAPGIGFAIASDRAKDLADQIVKNGRVVNSRRAYLGVEAADTTGGLGAFVVAVQQGGPAAGAGIQPGDRITGVNDADTPTAEALSIVLAGLNPGDAARLEISGQDGQARTVGVTLGELPS